MQDRPPITDSPWFWVLMFALMALFVLVLFDGRYGRRQSSVERKYQAAQRVAVGETGADASSDATGRRPYSSPDHPLIPLWPLTLIMFLIALIAGGMLWRDRNRPGPAPAHNSPP